MKDLIQRSLAIVSAGAGLVLTTPAWGQQAGVVPDELGGLKMAGPRPALAEPSDADACNRLRATFEARNTLSPSRRDELVRACLANLEAADLLVARQPVARQPVDEK
jgi:hypothetical protein